MPVLIARVESTSLQPDSTRGDDQGPVVNPRNFSCRQWRGRLFSWAALFFLCRLSMLWTAPPAARADTRSGNRLTCGRCRPAPLQKPLSPAHLRGFFWRGRLRESQRDRTAQSDYTEVAAGRSLFANALPVA